jgi:hypothetical protein
MAIRFDDPGADEDALLAEINTTPLVDVMLVLLIIFLITDPGGEQLDRGGAAARAQPGARGEARTT